jgi:hypothetical protein
MEDAEFERAGEEGRWLIAGGDGAVKELPELRCW